LCKGLRTAGFSNSPDGKRTESLPVMQLQELTLELDEGVEERDQMQNPRIQGLLKPGIGPVVSPRTKTLKWGGTAGSPRPLENVKEIPKIKKSYQYEVEDVPELQQAASHAHEEEVGCCSARLLLVLGVVAAVIVIAVIAS